MSLILQLECKLHERRGFSLLLIAKCAAISKVWTPGTIYWLYTIISFFRLLPLPDSRGTAVFIRSKTSPKGHKNGSPCEGSDGSDGGSPKQDLCLELRTR